MSEPRHNGPGIPRDLGAAMRISVRHVMAGVLAAGLLLGCVKELFFYNSEPDRSLLPDGAPVMIWGPVGHGIPLLESPSPDYVTPIRGNCEVIDRPGGQTIVAGSRCTVVQDIA